MSFRCVDSVGHAVVIVKPRADGCKASLSHSLLMHRQKRGPAGPRFRPIVELAVAGVRQRPQDNARVLIHGLPNVHGDGENNYEKK
jgi:hypothetical protein